MYDADFLRKIAEVMKFFAGQYEGLADSLESGDITEIEAKNWKTLRQSIEHIQKALNQTYGAYNGARIHR